MKRRAAPVLFDLQATQSVEQRHRGIPRYVLELALALEETAPEMMGAYLVNPDRALPEAAERLVATGKLRPADDVDWAAAGLLHIASPLEMTVPPHRQLPVPARRAGVPRAITFYDLIPYLMPEHYLEDPGLRRRYQARLQLVRTAAGVLTLSEATRRDVVEHLGLDPRRVFTVGTGTSAHFVPPASREIAAAAAAAAVPGLRPPYVFYIGSYERRKNLEPLLDAWAQVPAGVRGRWQLALCCPLQASELRHLEYRSAQMGLSPAPGGDVCFTGFVPDESLLLLHQGSDLFVFPSLYEGYGLPVAEALAAGAPVLAADSSSLPEIVGPEALFDPTDTAAMAAAIERGLTDDGLRRLLLARTGRPPTTWPEVAAATVNAYERLLSGGLDVARRARAGAVAARPRLALIGPAGERLAGLAEALGSGAEVHAFVDRPAGMGRERRALAAVGGAPAHPLAALETVEEHGGAYDSVVYLLADDEHHSGVLAALRRRRDGIVVSASARLAGLYGHAARSGALAEGLERLIHTTYGAAVPPGVGRGNTLPADEARRRGVLLARDAVAASERFLAPQAQAALARLDVRRRDRHKVEPAPADPAGLAGAILAAPPGGRDHAAVPAPTAVVFDLSALQSVDQRHRGIARYVSGLVDALEEPVVEERGPGAVDAYLLNPDLALPEAVERLEATGKLRFPDEIDWSGVRLLHVPSLFEMGVPLVRLLPPAARDAGVPFSVTFHDLIPHLMPDHYLEDPGKRRRYRARLGLVRTAAAVLTNSEATRGDALAHLGVDPRRAVVAGTGTAPQFVPPASRPAAAAAAAGAVPGLRPPYAFYVGNYEPRKNLGGLLEAWSRLDPAVRERHQLVINAAGTGLQRNHLRVEARRLGVGDDLLLLDFVPDDLLVTLHQGAELFVFPSLYEGYGLPVAEALACGAAVLAARNSSLPEILPPDALFDPDDPAALAAALERGLTDQAFRARLLAASGRPPATWPEVASRTAAVFDRARAGEFAAAAGAGPPRPRLALVAPLAAGAGPVAEWNARLLAGLRRRGDVHAFADRGAAESPIGTAPGVVAHPLGAFGAVENLTGAFDAVVYSIADDEHHVGSLGALRRRPGVVLAHDVRLANLYGHAARAGALPEGLPGVLQAAYGDAIPPGLGRRGELAADDARRRGVLLMRDVAAAATRVLVAAPAAAELARLDAHPPDRAKVAVLPGWAESPAAAAGALYELVSAAGPAGPSRGGGPARS